MMVALVSVVGIVDGSMSTYFGFSRYYCAERTKAGESDRPELEMKNMSSGDGSSPTLPSKKTPSPVRLNTHSVL